MAYEMKELTGSLFKNQKKEKDTHPNVTGSALIDGVNYWVSAWTKKDKNGNLWQSLSFQKKDAKVGEEKPAKTEKFDKSNPFEDFSDDIPF